MADFQLSFTASEINEKLNKISTPDWAQEDPNGEGFIKNKPEIPEYVEQVQANWEQDDETQPDFIKNKPFYSIKDATSVTETFYDSLNGDPTVDYVERGTFDSIQAVLTPSTSVQQQFKEGAEITSTFEVSYDLNSNNGVYSITRTGTVQKYSDELLYVGDAWLIEESQEHRPNMEPEYAITYNITTNEITIYVYTIRYGAYPGANVTLSSTYLADDVKQLDTKFINTVSEISESATNDQLPTAKAVYDYVKDSASGGSGNNVADWAQNDPNGEGYIQNRPFYSEEGETITLEATEMGDISPNIEVIAGETYEVTFTMEDGSTSTQFLTALSIYDAVGAKLENDDKMAALQFGDTGDDNATVFIFYNNCGFGESGPAYEEGGAIYMLRNAQSITLNLGKVHRIDEKYLPAGYGALKNDVQTLIEEQEELSDKINKVSSDINSKENSSNKANIEHGIRQSSEYPTISSVIKYIKDMDDNKSILYPNSDIIIMGANNDTTKDHKFYFDFINYEEGYYKFRDNTSEGDYWNPTANLVGVERNDGTEVREFIYNTTEIIATVVAGNPRPSVYRYPTTEDGHLDVTSFATITFDDPMLLGYTYKKQYFVVPDGKNAKLVCFGGGAFVEVPNVTLPRLTNGAKMVFCNGYFYLLGGDITLEDGTKVKNTNIFRMKYNFEADRVEECETLAEKIERNDYGLQVYASNNKIYTNAGCSFYVENHTKRYVIDVSDSNNVKISAQVNSPALFSCDNYVTMGDYIIIAERFSGSSEGQIAFYNTVTDEYIKEKITANFYNPTAISCYNNVIFVREQEDDNGFANVQRIIVDKKYLEKQQVEPTPDYCENNSYSQNFIKNKPFYEYCQIKTSSLLMTTSSKLTNDPIVPINIVNFAPSVDSWHNKIPAYVIPAFSNPKCGQIGDKYNILALITYQVWNNGNATERITIEETFSAKGTFTYNNINYIYAGNKFLLTNNEEDNTGEKYLVMFSDEASGYLVFDLLKYIPSLPEGSSINTNLETSIHFLLKKLENTSDIKQLDPKYIPDYISKTEVEELINNTSGGSSNEDAQPDWNQTDDTQPDYIKNRPFYAEIENGADIIIDIPSAEEEAGTETLQTNVNYVVGETYDISLIVDSEEITIPVEVVTAKDAGLDAGAANDCPTIFINSSMGGADTISLPSGKNINIIFALLCGVYYDSDAEELIPDNNYVTYIAYSMHSDLEIAIKIKGSGIVYHKIDKNYLPDDLLSLPDDVDNLENQLKIVDEKADGKTSAIAHNKDYTRSLKNEYPTVSAVKNYVTDSISKRIKVLDNTEDEIKVMPIYNDSKSLSEQTTHLFEVNNYVTGTNESYDTSKRLDDNSNTIGVSYYNTSVNEISFSNDGIKFAYMKKGYNQLTENQYTTSENMHELSNSYINVKGHRLFVVPENIDALYDRGAYFKEEDNSNIIRSYTNNSGIWTLTNVANLSQAPVRIGKVGGFRNVFEDKNTFTRTGIIKVYYPDENDGSNYNIYIGNLSLKDSTLEDTQEDFLYFYEMSSTGNISLYVKDGATLDHKSVMGGSEPISGEYIDYTILFNVLEDSMYMLVDYYGSQFTELPKAHLPKIIGKSKLAYSNGYLYILGGDIEEDGEILHNTEIHRLKIDTYISPYNGTEILIQENFDKYETLATISGFDEEIYAVTVNDKIYYGNRYLDTSDSNCVLSYDSPITIDKSTVAVNDVIISCDWANENIIIFDTISNTKKEVQCSEFNSENLSRGVGAYFNNGVYFLKCYNETDGSAFLVRFEIDKALLISDFSKINPDYNITNNKNLAYIQNRPFYDDSKKTARGLVISEPYNDTYAKPKANYYSTQYVSYLVKASLGNRNENNIAANNIYPIKISVDNNFYRGSAHSRLCYTINASHETIIRDFGSYKSFNFDILRGHPGTYSGLYGGNLSLLTEDSKDDSGEDFCFIWFSILNVTDQLAAKIFLPECRTLLLFDKTRLNTELFDMDYDKFNLYEIEIERQFIKKLDSKFIKSSLEISNSSTDDEFTTAKSVYNYVNKLHSSSSSEFSSKIPELASNIYPEGQTEVTLLDLFDDLDLVDDTVIYRIPNLVTSDGEILNFVIGDYSFKSSRYDITVIHHAHGYYSERYHSGIAILSPVGSLAAELNPTILAYTYSDTDVCYVQKLLDNSSISTAITENSLNTEVASALATKNYIDEQINALRAELQGS